MKHVIPLAVFVMLVPQARAQGSLHVGDISVTRGTKGTVFTPPIIKGEPVGFVGRVKEDGR